TTLEGVTGENVARLNRDGTLDMGFQTGLALTNSTFAPDVSSLAVQGDDKVLIGGNFTGVNGVSRTNIARLNADGTLDSGFQTGVWHTNTNMYFGQAVSSF